MSTINDTDQFLVQRGSNSFKQSAKDLMSTIKDTDLMLIQRGSSSYKVTCEDVKDQLGGGGVVVEVSKGVISPVSGVEGGDTLTGTATVTGNVDPTVYIHKWFVNGVQAAETTNTFIAKEGNVTYQLCVTDPNNTTPICGAISDAVTVGPRTTPNATMHGLRISKKGAESDVGSYLRRVDASGAPDGDFTYSAWVKKTDELETLFSAQGTQKSTIAANKSVFFVAATINKYKDFPYSLEANQWGHVVVSCKDTVYTAYLNGEELGQHTMDEASFTEAGPKAIGANAADGEQASNNGEGYISDVYYVDGRALPPTTFGKDFEAGWGPLDSSIVLDNIGIKISPYDTRPNMEQKWSDTFTTSQGWFSDDYNNLKAFDGSTTTYATLTSAGTAAKDPITFSPSGGISGITSIEIKGKGNFSFDGVEKKDTGNAEDVFTITDVASFNTMTINHISGESGVGSQVFYIKINGQILKDGPADNSQNWSDIGDWQLPSNKFWQSPLSNGFDGDPTTKAYLATSSDQVTWDCSGLGLSGSIRVRPHDSINSENYVITVNGQTLAGQSDAWTASATFADITEITFAGNNPYDTAICQIEVGGKVLVDSGEQWDTSQVWSELGTITNPTTPDIPVGHPANPISRLYDGDENIGWGTTGSVVKSQMGLNYPFTSTVKIKAQTQTNGGGYVKVYGSNGTSSTITNDIGSDFPATNTTYELEFTGLDSPVTGIEFTNGGGLYMYEVKLDNKVLIDAGTLGDNGFFLPFAPENIGGDASDQGNDFTAQNFASLDTVTDTPMRSYAVLDPASGVTVKNGNLVRAGSTAGNAFSTINMSSGKYYWENTIIDATTGAFAGVTTYASLTNDYQDAYFYINSGQKYVDGALSQYGDPFGAGDVIGCLYDADVGSLTCFKNGIPQGVLVIGLTNPAYALNRSDGTSEVAINFGQQPLVYATDNGDGTVTLKGGSPNMDEVWSNYLTAEEADGTVLGFEAAKPPAYAFDGRIGNGSDDTTYTASVEAGAAANNKIIFTPPTNSIDIQTDIRVYGWGGSGGRTIEVVTSNGTFNGTILDSAVIGEAVIACTGTLISITSTSPVDTITTAHVISGIVSDGETLIDGFDVGPFNTLSQTWMQQKGAALRLAEARVAEDQQRISQLETVIIEQSIPFERDMQYPKGAIVDIAGELYEAQVDGADVRAADFIARLFREGSEEWLKLDITTREKPSFPSGAQIT